MIDDNPLHFNHPLRSLPRVIIKFVRTLFLSLSLSLCLSPLTIYIIRLNL